ncbi:MAG: pyridoxal 5'-phosphate synthase glutaminase subunit PdxT [Firmicutes bacterium]|nr:pyridoxal 5'-phosphate synthase glutaminase subunit PdxT [Bacillota bacterium]
MSQRIGVLNVQGAVSEHATHLRRVGAEVHLVRRPEDLTGLAGIVLPGGESTTIGKLLKKYGLFEPLRDRIAEGMPVFGTCAGMILLAERILGGDDPHLAVMDVTVDRNSFGRQRESFEANVAMADMEGDSFPAVFIRAPHIVDAKPSVRVLAEIDGKIVAARQGQMLATAFHPELTDDLRLHRYFSEMVGTSSYVSAMS